MCAVVGVINSPNAAMVAYYALFAMQHRGQESSGISVGDGKKLRCIKGLGAVSSVFSEEKLAKLKGSLAIGHNRYCTSGKNSHKDAQPINATCGVGELSLVHNGNLVNKMQIRDELTKSGAIFSTQMDTENIIHLIARSSASTLKERFCEALSKSKGAYCFILATPYELFIAKDPYGIRPLSLGRLEDGGFIFASETCAFDLVGASFIKDISPGELIHIKLGENSYESELLAPAKTPRICAFEYIYFARPNSVIEGKSVYAVREKMGEMLAKDFKEEIDFVVGVPDSGMYAARGFARELQKPLELALVRSHYIGRTFIEPTQSLRDLKVKLKLSPIKSLLEGKNIVVIDDSLVRGTTSKQIISLLKNAGAKNVHLGLACPPIKYPDTYGIDTPDINELISARLNEDDLCKALGAASLSFLSLDGMRRALGDEREYSTPSFDGTYFI